MFFSVYLLCKPCIESHSVSADQRCCALLSGTVSTMGFLCTRRYILCRPTIPGKRFVAHHLLKRRKYSGRLKRQSGGFRIVLSFGRSTNDRDPLSTTVVLVVLVVYTETSVPVRRDARCDIEAATAQRSWLGMNVCMTFRLVTRIPEEDNQPTQDGHISFCGAAPKKRGQATSRFGLLRHGQWDMAHTTASTIGVDPRHAVSNAGG